MKKHLIVLLLITLILSSTGCIDVYLGKEMLGGRVESEKYKTVEKAGMSYAFETVPPNSENTKYSDSRDFSIKKETVWIHVNIDYDQAAGVPNPLNVYRHLTVTVFSDKYNQTWTYNDTAQDIKVVESPPSGSWKIEIEAEGVGYLDYKDSFTVTVFAKEPYRPSS